MARELGPEQRARRIQSLVGARTLKGAWRQIPLNERPTYNTFHAWVRSNAGFLAMQPGIDAALVMSSPSSGRLTIHADKLGVDAMLKIAAVLDSLPQNAAPTQYVLAFGKVANIVDEWVRQTAPDVPNIENPEDLNA